MKSRERKALFTYLSRKVQRISDTVFTVQGRKRKDGSHNEPWLVRVNEDGAFECNCPPYGEEMHCKHVDTVTKWLTDGEPTSHYPQAGSARPTYPQDWRRYRPSRHNTRWAERELIRDLAQSVFPRSTAPRKRGRPWLETADVIQCVAARGISNTSSDHADSDVRQLWKDGFLFHSPAASHWPSPSAITRRMRSEQIRDAFGKLIAETACLTRDTDHTFAIDGSEYNVPNRDPEDPDLVESFGKSRKGKTIRSGRRMPTIDQQIRQIMRLQTVKLHALVAHDSGLMVRAIVTTGKAGESPYLRELVEDASKTHMIQELAADRGYIGEENAAFLEERHIRNLTPVKRSQKGKAGTALRKHYENWVNPDTGLQDDAGKRECSEGFFSRNKRVEREDLKARTLLAQQTELLMIVLLANIRQLIQLYIYGDIEDIPWLSESTRRELKAERDKVKDLPRPDLSPKFRDDLGKAA